MGGQRPSAPYGSASTTLNPDIVREKTLDMVRTILYVTRSNSMFLKPTYLPACLSVSMHMHTVSVIVPPASVAVPACKEKGSLSGCCYM